MNVSVEIQDEGYRDLRKKRLDPDDIEENGTSVENIACLLLTRIPGWKRKRHR